MPSDAGSEAQNKELREQSAMVRLVVPGAVLFAQ